MKVGKSFVATPPPIQILLFPPDALYKYNHKGETIEGFDSMTPARQDSALFFTSKLIKGIDDSLFLEGYVNNFITELRKLGFTVYLPEAVDSLLKAQPQVYTLDMAQLQLDEYIYPFEDEAVFYDTRYIKSIDLNAIDFSVWYELSKMNTTNPRKTVLYSSHTMTDGVDGSFFLEPFTDDVRYRYRIDSISVPDVMTLSANLGKKHASYLYDFFLNQYIAFHLPQGEAPYYFYHYNRFRNILLPVEDDDKFEILDQK
jgi:hypothetical protein